jgi:predicted dehydrogenase
MRDVGFWVMGNRIGNGVVGGCGAKELKQLSSRRSFLKSSSFAAAVFGFTQPAAADQTIPGFETAPDDQDTSKAWEPVTDRKIRVGLVGYGFCKFAAAFGFQHHPNVEIVAVSDLFPDRCAELAGVTKCTKIYPSLEELVKDDGIDAVFIATDAPSHAKHSIEVLKHGKHVASAVPAVFGSLEEADKLLNTVRASGRKYMMFETSAFHEDVITMRQIYEAGGFGKLIYSEGEYFHYAPEPLPSYKDWRVGIPPQWYPTHSNAYYICASDGSFTEVACLGMPSVIEHLKASNNRYNNSFGTEVALFRTSEGGMSRMAVSWDTPGPESETGRIRGQKGSFSTKYDGFGTANSKAHPIRLPPGLSKGGHGGSHGYLTNEFITAILQDRKPLVSRPGDFVNTDALLRIGISPAKRFC